MNGKHERVVSYQSTINTHHIVFIMLFLPSVTSSTDKPVTDVCLGCICEAISGCNQTRFCGSGVCGLFRITWAYWADGGKLTLGNDSPQSEDGKCKQIASPCVTPY